MLLLLLLLPVFHTDSYACIQIFTALGPRSIGQIAQGPRTIYSGPGTRDHWLNFYWSRDQNGMGPWAKWKKKRASRLANNWNCQIVAPELKTDGQTGYTYRSRRTTKWTLQDFPTLKSIDRSNVTLTQCSSIFEYLQWRHQIWRHWSSEKRGGLITPISAPA